MFSRPFHSVGACAKPDSLQKHQYENIVVEGEMSAEQKQGQGQQNSRDQERTEERLVPEKRRENRVGSLPRGRQGFGMFFVHRVGSRNRN